MVQRVFVDVGVSLDGFIAGENRCAGNPLGDGGVAIHDWMFHSATFMRKLVRKAEILRPTTRSSRPCSTAPAPT